MAIIHDITNFKCFNQLKNGENFDSLLSEYTTELVGNVGERVKVEYEVRVDIVTEGSVLNHEPLGGTTAELSVDGINWRDEGFALNDSIIVYKDNVQRIGSGPITLISEDGSVMNVDLSTSPNSELLIEGTVNDFVVERFGALGDNRFAACIFSYGILENKESFNTLSKVTGESQSFYADLQVLSPTTFETKGVIRGWEDDIVTGTIESVIGIVSITHEFIIQPYFTVDQVENIESVTPPDNLAGENSFKYVTNFQFRKGLTSINTNIEVQAESILGDVGYFGENFNGFNPNYQVESVSFQDPDTLVALDSVQIFGRTRTTIEVSKLSGSFAVNEKFAAYISYLPESDEEYIAQKTNFDEIFLYDSLTARVDLSNGGSGIIEFLSATIDGGGNLIIEVDTLYNATQQENLTKDQRYVLWIQVEDRNLSSEDSDRIALIASLDNYQEELFIPDLINWTKFDLIQHNQVLGDAQEALDTWNEDGLILDSEFNLDLSKESVLTGMTVKLVAYDSVNDVNFELDSFVLPLDSITSNGIQEINFETNRGYILKSEDDFNIVKIETGSKIGDLQYYTLQIGQKIKWQDWIENVAVDPDFYDKTKINNNLNFKASNYSDLLGYQITVMVESNLTGVDTIGRSGVGFDQNYSSDIKVYDYDVSDDGVITDGAIELYDPDTMVTTQGQVLKSKDTLFRIVWTVSDDSITDAYSILRIQDSGSAGDNKSELSTIRARLEGDLIKPVTGDFASLYSDSGNIVTEGLIDFTKLDATKDYDLSGRLFKPPPASFVFTVQSNNTGTSNHDQFTFPQRSGTSPNYTMEAVGVGIPDIIVTADTDPTTFTFPVEGTYTIKITGTDIQPNFNNGGDRRKLLSLDTMGTVIFGSSSFFGCTNMEILALDNPTLSTAINSCFENCSSMVGNSTMDAWDVSSITTMSRLFRGCASFNQNLNSWDVSSVTNMGTLFFGCSDFNGFIINWDVSNVTDMSEMFEFASSFSGSLTWDVSSVTNMESMFEDATSFTGSNIGTWNVSNVTNMFRMFNGCTSFNVSLNSWSVGSVTNMGNMFQNCVNLNQGFNNWDVSSVTALNSIFSGCAIFTGNVTSWDVSNVTNFRNSFFGCSAFNRDISGWNVSSATDMNGMFSGCLVFNEDLSGWVVSSVQDMGSMFENTGAFSQNLNSWNVSSVTTMESMFEDSAFNGLISGWNVSSVELMNRMFNGCSSFNQDLSAWVFSSLENMNGILSDSGLSTANYDLLLVSWDGQVIPLTDFGIGVNDLIYSFSGAAEDARNSLIGKGWIFSGDSGVATDADALTWIGNMTSPSQTEQSAINAFVIDDKASGNWSTRDYLIIPSLGSTNGLVDAFGKTGSALGGVTFDVNGAATDGINGFLNTGFNLSTDGVNYVQNDAKITMYLKVASNVSGTVAMGVDDGANVRSSFLTFGGDLFPIVNGSAVGFTDAFANEELYSSVRTTVNDIAMYESGVSINSQLFASSGVPSGGNLVVGGENSSGVTSDFYAGTFSFISIGGGIGFDHVSEDADVTTLLTALGTI